jgi:hypothetical protein
VVVIVGGGPLCVGLDILASRIRDEVVGRVHRQLGCAIGCECCRGRVRLPGRERVDGPG